MMPQHPLDMPDSQELAPDNATPPIYTMPDSQEQNEAVGELNAAALGALSGLSTGIKQFFFL